MISIAFKWYCACPNKCDYTSHADAHALILTTRLVILWNCCLEPWIDFDGFCVMLRGLSFANCGMLCLKQNLGPNHGLETGLDVCE